MRITYQGRKYIAVESHGNDEGYARLMLSAPKLVAELSTLCVEWEDAAKRLARDFDNKSYEELLPEQYHRAKVLIAKATSGGVH